MISKKLKYGPSLKNKWINMIRNSLGLMREQDNTSLEIYETFQDYMSLEQCSRSEALDFTAKYYRLSKPQTKQILSDFNRG